MWDEEPHIVLRQSIPEIPVFDVRQEDGNGRVTTLHRNELLPFNSVPVEEIAGEQSACEKYSLTSWTSCSSAYRV